MNKHCFRLIFSKSLGFLIPVAEICSAQRKPGQTSQPSSTVSPSALPPTRWRLNALPLALFGLMPHAFADIVVEPGQQTTMTQSANGVPVVEIADPNSKGLSHNRFEQFNVSKPGLIFNNSLRDGTSQIGANNHVTHNPNLTREATAILTEVTGNSPSTLAGTLEVFGGKADILIANLGGMAMNVGGGVVGALNTDAGKQTEITSDSKVAGTDIKIEISIPNLKNNKKNNKVDPETKETKDQATQTDPEVDVVDGGGSDKLARHMSQATTGNQLKTILAMFNGDSATKEFLKQNPVELKVRNANGEVVPYPVHDAASLKALHGLNVVTGERAEKNYRGPLDAKLGYSSNLYIKLIPQPSGGFRYVLTPTKPKPLPTANF